MKKLMNNPPINIRKSRLLILSAGMVITFCLFANLTFSQSVDIVSPSSNTTYRLPDPGTLVSPEAVKGAIVTAELAGKSLSSDIASEKNVLTNAENDLTKAQTMKSDYLAALNNYTKNGYDPYMADLNSYTPNLDRYKEILTRHNTATDASNALPAEQRSAATVASLNSEKTELDNWRAKLDTWVNSLDAAKAKLDAQREVLIQQKQQYETAFQSAMDRLRASQEKLNAALEQLKLCAKYADQCRALLVSKFNINLTGTSGTGYFGSTVYQGSVNDLNTELEKLKHLSGKAWDGN